MAVATRAIDAAVSNVAMRIRMVSLKFRSGSKLAVSLFCPPEESTLDKSDGLASVANFSCGAALQEDMLFMVVIIRHINFMIALGLNT